MANRPEREATPQLSAGDRLAAARRSDGEAKAAQVRAALGEFERGGATFSTSELGRVAQVSRRFLYDHPELLAEADQVRVTVAAAGAGAVVAGAQVTAASLRADLENARAQNRRLQDQNRRLEARVAEHLGAEVAADAGWVPAQVQARLDDLVEERDQARADARRLEEELEQARRLNRELMAETNKQARH